MEKLPNRSHPKRGDIFERTPLMAATFAYVICGAKKEKKGQEKVPHPLNVNEEC